VPDEFLHCLKTKPQVCEIEVIRDGKDGKRGARWHKVSIKSFLALKGLKLFTHNICIAHNRLRARKGILKTSYSGNRFYNINEIKKNVRREMFATL